MKKDDLLKAKKYIQEAKEVEWYTLKILKLEVWVGKAIDVPVVQDMYAAKIPKLGLTAYGDTEKEAKIKLVEMLAAIIVSKSRYNKVEELLNGFIEIPSK